MAEGTLKVQISKYTIDNEILPANDHHIYAMEECILALNQWAIPHWDWITTVNVGAVKTNKNTINYILERCTQVVLSKDRVFLLWLNYGWSVDETLKDWECRIDFDKIEYKESK